jgi:hypothetical protein
VRWGKPYQEVLAYAREQEIDLICLGAKGKNFSMGALFGSNTDRVLRQAPCPVLVARPLRPAVLAHDCEIIPTMREERDLSRLGAGMKASESR